MSRAHGLQARHRSRHAVQGGHGICDQVLADAKRLGGTQPCRAMTVEEGFRRVGADEWDALRDRYR